MLRPTPGDPQGAEQHHWSTGAKENAPVVFTKFDNAKTTSIEMGRHVQLGSAFSTTFVRGFPWARRSSILTNDVQRALDVGQKKIKIRDFRKLVTIYNLVKINVNQFMHDQSACTYTKFVQLYKKQTKCTNILA